jgi:hypothetical protein
VQVREDRLGRFDPDVGCKQARFQFLEQGGIDAPPRQEVRDPGGAAIDARAQAREEAVRAYGWITELFVITTTSPSLARKSAIWL